MRQQGIDARIPETIHERPGPRAPEIPVRSMLKPGRIAIFVLFCLRRACVAAMRPALASGLLWFALVSVSPAHAQGVVLDGLSSGMLGRAGTVMLEHGSAFSAEEALTLQRQGAFKGAGAAVPKFGIGSPPVWFHLAVDNRGDRAVSRRLLAGASWIERLDVFIVRGGVPVSQWVAGDGDASRRHPLGSLGYAFDHDFEPGITEILLRAETADPLVLPVRLLSPDAATAAMRLQDYGYGMLYGFLLALIAYNAMLYAGLRDSSHLNYALYLATFILLNISYSGRGYEWLWPESVIFQQYVTLVLMVLFGCAGLRFASSFLELGRLHPQAERGVRVLMRIGLGAIALTVVMQSQAAAAVVAFVFVLAFSVLMVGLGVLSLRHGRRPASYFLAGAVVAMAGAAVTATCVWAGLPYSEAFFHAAELGMVLEGSLLALALAYRMRLVQAARTEAEHLSRIDPLTGLLNRRAFLGLADGVWSTAVRKGRPLSIILIDLDHFKAINDTYGHETGDLALSAVAGALNRNCRRGDISARWGGEEFILLLPETSAEQARAMAVRLLSDIRAMPVADHAGAACLSASLGVVERRQHEVLEALIREADGCMYEAKRAGRGCVCGVSPAGGGAALAAD
ncbi:MAG: GGDEF domain-containing protein [Betaproteobacteria bacterium HGW-Betaproteobacteria-13]|jgi:diguanylate cyclase (GGDEF)-like protein|nr:MAG: GGDEF domain-containing protein [Betaproteobacteria bacterium HGW-Betaproteobacteria-13]